MTERKQADNGACEHCRTTNVARRAMKQALFEIGCRRLKNRDMLGPPAGKQLFHYDNWKDDESEQAERVRLTRFMRLVFVTSWSTATDTAALESAGIRRVLNVSDTSYSESVVKKLSEAKIIMCHVPFGDDEPADHLDDWRERVQKCIVFLRAAESEDDRVVVHCKSGVNRSPTVCLAWAMFKLASHSSFGQHTTGAWFRALCAHLARIRPCVAINPRFVRWLLTVDCWLARKSGTHAT